MLTAVLAAIQQLAVAHLARALIVDMSTKVGHVRLGAPARPLGSVGGSGVFALCLLGRRRAYVTGLPSVLNRLAR